MKQRLTKEKSAEREIAALEILAHHRGKHNAITSADLARALTDRGLPTSRAMIPNIARALQSAHHSAVLACNLGHGRGGYYLPERGADIRECISFLSKKRDGIQEQIDALSRFV